MRKNSPGRPRRLAALALTGTLVLPAAATGHAIVLERPARDPAAPLPAATDVVRFTVLAADGHITQGALRFSVKAGPSSSSSPRTSGGRGS